MRRLRLAAIAGAMLIAGCGGSPSDSVEPTPTGSVTVESPSGEVRTPTPSPSSTPPTATPTPVAGTTYTVIRGDSLSSIAIRFGTTAERLQAWNAGRYPSLSDDPGRIEPGWAL